LREAAEPGDAGSIDRLASDHALSGLTSVGAETFNVTHSRPDQFPDTAFVLLAGRRPPGSTDDDIEVVSALGLTGSLGTRPATQPCRACSHIFVAAIECLFQVRADRAAHFVVVVILILRVSYLCESRSCRRFLVERIKCTINVSSVSDTR